MTLPPTRLTTFLASASHDPVYLYRAMDAQGLLTSAALAAPAETQAMLRRSIDEAEARPPKPGPSVADLLARDLLATDLLSDRGRAWSEVPPNPAPLPSGWHSVWMVLIFAVRPGVESLSFVTGSGPIFWSRAPVVSLAYTGCALLMLAALPWRHPLRGYSMQAFGLITAAYILLNYFADRTLKAVAGPTAFILIALLVIGLFWWDGRKLNQPDNRRLTIA